MKFLSSHSFLTRLCYSKIYGCLVPRKSVYNQLPIAMASWPIYLSGSQFCTFIKRKV